MSCIGFRFDVIFPLEHVNVVSQLLGVAVHKFWVSLKLAVFFGCLSTWCVGDHRLLLLYLLRVEAETDGDVSIEP